MAKKSNKGAMSKVGDAVKKATQTVAETTEEYVVKPVSKMLGSTDKKKTTKKAATAKKSSSKTAAASGAAKKTTAKKTAAKKTPAKKTAAKKK